VTLRLRRFGPDAIRQTTPFGFDPSSDFRLGGSLDVGPSVALHAHLCQYADARASHGALAQLSHNWDNLAVASRNAEGKERVARGSGNVFADLRFPDAAERQAKLRLAHTLNQLLDGRKLSQAEAAKVLGVSQPKISALRNYKLAGFSVERLMNLLTALDQDVEIVIRKKPRSRKLARISVVAA
jgi:predicted XRE-type DNA-binding protein